MISKCFAVLVDFVYYFACWLAPVLLALLSIVWPCFASLPSSLFCDSGENWPCLWKLIRFGTPILEFIAYRTASVACSHYTISITGSGMAALWLYCKELVQGYNNILSYYIKMKVLEKIFNSIIKDRIFLTLTLFCPLLQVLVGYSIIAIIPLAIRLHWCLL